MKLFFFNALYRLGWFKSNTVDLKSYTFYEPEQERPTLAQGVHVHRGEFRSDRHIQLGKGDEKK